MFSVKIDDGFADVYSVLSVVRDDSGTDFLIWYNEGFVWMPSYRCKFVQ